MSADGGPGNREVAYRVFAAEFEDATVSFKESDEERAPNYVISPTGGRLNRLFSVGVFTEKAEVGGGQVRARINDLTGTLVTYAGQYQPGPQAFLENADPPAFLALTGKARTFEPEDGDRIYSSVRPESVNEVDAATRDRWVVRTAEQTVARVGSMAAARLSNLRGDDLRDALVEAGLTESLASGTAIAVAEYAPTSEYLQSIRSRAIQAAEVVAGERDEVERLDLRPTEGADDQRVLAELATIELPEGEATPTPEPEPAVEDDEPVETEPIAADPAGGSSTEGDAGASAGSEPETAAEPEPEAEPEETVADAGTGTEVEAEPEPEPEQSEAEPEAEPVVETEPEAEPAVEAESEPEPTVDEDDDIEDFEPGEFDLDEEEREEVEEQFGTDFETASEFDPDEESIEPEAEAEADAAAEPEPEAESEQEPEPETEAETETESEAEPEPEPEPEPTADADPADVVVEVIDELDEGDGADRDAVVAELVDRTGADADTADEAISSALMNGECYEPDDGLLKAI